MLEVFGDVEEVAGLLDALEGDVVPLAFESGDFVEVLEPALGICGRDDWLGEELAALDDHFPHEFLREVVPAVGEPPLFPREERVEREPMRVERDAGTFLAWVGKGGFNVTSTRVFSDDFFQKKHSSFDTLKRDDHSSKNELKRVETDRDLGLQR